VRRILNILKELTMDKNKAQAYNAISLNKHIFKYLKNNISLKALKRIDLN
jgi:hypothetical protein